MSDHLEAQQAVVPTNWTEETLQRVREAVTPLAEEREDILTIIAERDILRRKLEVVRDDIMRLREHAQDRNQSLAAQEYTRILDAIAQVDTP